MTTGFLLDTNVVSETRKARCNPGVSDFLKLQPQSRLYVSVLTIGELHKGAMMRRRSQPNFSQPNFADELAVWIDTTETTFAPQVLPVDAAIARRWGELSADRTCPVVDTLLVATALVHDLTLVTRNTIDVRGTGVVLLDPFT